MRSGVPWSIRGIDDETREAARAAARQSGLSVSEWLNDLIAEQTAKHRTARSRHDFDDSGGDAAAIQRLTGRIRTMDVNSHTALSGLRHRLDEIEECLAVRVNLDSHGAARARSPKSVAAVVDELSREIDDADETARSVVEGLRDRGDAEGAGRETGAGRVAEAIRKLDARISLMSERIKSPSADEAPAKLETIKAHLDVLLARSPEQSSGSGESLDATLRSLETHIDQAESRLNAATQQTPSSSMTAAEEDHGRWLEERIGEITGGIAAARSSESPDSDIASAVDEISVRQRRIDELADYAALANEQRRASSSLVALRADVAAVADKISSSSSGGATDTEASLRLTERIDELGRRLPDGERIESRLDAISARIDGFLGNASPTDTIGELHKRFATLLERVEGISAAQSEPTNMLEGIKVEIAGIRREIVDQAQPKIDNIEAQIAELAHRLDLTAQSQPEGEVLAELEAQIAHLASELEQSMPRNATLKQVEENLARLQDHLCDNRQESVEAARLAARAAVHEMADVPADSELVCALKDDLEKIRAAAGEADQRSQQTLGSVHGMLARVVERLTRLENEGEKLATARAREPSGMPENDAGKTPVPRAQAGSAIGAYSGAAGAQGGMTMSGAEAGKPDLAALRELARSTAEVQPDKKGDRRADFIAAARRAAQVATIEAARAVEDQADEGEPGTFARIGLAIRDRKRPLLLAGAALVLAISVVQLFGERGVETVNNSADVAEIGSNANDYQGANLGQGFSVAGMPAAATKTSVGNSALMTTPPDVRAAMAFGMTESLDSHFSMASAVLSAKTFERSSGDTSPKHREAASVMPSVSVPMVTAAAGSESELAIAPSTLRQAAEIGDPAAAFEVAVRYAEGKSVRRDLVKAASWYERAAGAGLAVAQYRLGGLLERGEGVAKDRAAAANWYQRAADQGNIGAMHNLAVMMSEGVEGAPDHRKAFEWFFAAANYGVVDSQYNLGVVFARGLGQDKDFIETYKWFAIAAAAGDADAGVRRGEVEKSLSADDLAKARAAAKAWRAITPIAEANTVVAPSGGWESASAGMTDADRRSLVTNIQGLLAKGGYDPGPVDGFEGPRTREAVRAFQSKFGLAATGIISGDLATALFSQST